MRRILKPWICLIWGLYFLLTKPKRNFSGCYPPWFPLRFPHPSSGGQAPYLYNCLYWFWFAPRRVYRQRYWV